MSRSVDTILWNDTANDLTLRKAELEEGEWTKRPPQTIKAKTRIAFGAKNAHYLRGTEGTVVYRSPNNGLVSWFFENPELGSSTFTLGYAGDVRAARSGDENGDHVTQTVTVEPQPQPNYRRTTRVMQQIKTVVYLMLENRSLDHVLGWLYDGDVPSHFYPGGFSSFDGASTSNSNTVDRTAYSQTRGIVGAKHPLRVTGFDPYEPMPHVKTQLYGSGNHSWDDEPSMSGFASDYASAPELTSHPGQVMGCFTADQLPILNGLAKHFAVSDRWFCSMPTQTDPNRAFSVCGTSLGAEVNDDIHQRTFIDATTIFNALGNVGRSWGLYWQMDNPKVAGTHASLLGPWTPFTSYYFSQLTGAPNGKVEKYDEFLEDLANGNAPDFCYLEPFWGGGKGTDDDDSKNFFGMQGNDYHPPAWLGPGEASLNALYERLIHSPQWKDMLFIITFDEHGGTYDHVPPPKTVPPDKHRGKSGFAFERLGVRVPTILISPYIQPKTVFRAPPGHHFDHTSVLATLLKWAGVEPSSAGLGARTAVAPTFEGVLSDTRRTDPPPRFQVPSSYAGQGGGVGTWHVGDLPTEDFEPTPWPEYRKLCEDEGVSNEEFLRRVRQLFTGRRRAARRGGSLLARIWLALLRLLERLGLLRGRSQRRGRG